MCPFEVRECTDPDCRLRLPIDTEIHSGAFCPRCGAPMKCVAPPFTNSDSPHEVGLPNRQLSVILDNIRSAYNVGAIFRTADGVGLQHIYLCGITPTPDDNVAIEKTALGAEGGTPWSSHPNAVLLARNLRERGYRLLALECTPNSVLIQNYPLDQVTNQPMALVLGNERSGIDPGLIALCDAVIALPMVGGKGSLNVAVAFGAAAYWLSFG